MLDKKTVHELINEHAEALHKAVDSLPTKEAEQVTTHVPVQDKEETPEADAPKRELPEGKRVVRTKTSGDRVYLLDDTKEPKTRQWVTSPEVLARLGFEMSDVVDVEDTELIKYQMGAALYKVE